MKNSLVQNNTINWIVLGGSWFTNLFLIAILAFAEPNEIVMFTIIGFLGLVSSVMLYSVIAIVDFSAVETRIKKRIKAAEDSTKKSSKSKKTSSTVYGNPTPVHA